MTGKHTVEMFGVGVTHMQYKSLIYFVFRNAPPHLFLSPGCDSIPVEYLRWGDPEPIAAVVFACLGQMATFFVTAVFIR